ncbi:MAG: SOS mutagenesis and repair protein UmuC, partial [Bacteroidetes bacterium]|nr:SOS mutagenesis and repair protein UmuC [Bacteroidota bacterium]
MNYLIYVCPPNTLKKLKSIGITKAYDFTQLPDEWVKKNLSIVEYRLKKELEGVPMTDLEIKKPKKNIATTRSFDTNYKDFDTIKERVSTFAATCAEKLRKQKSNCNALLVFLHTNEHRKDLPQYNKSIVVKLPYATNSSIDLSHYAVKGLKAIFKLGFQYKKAGV